MPDHALPRTQAGHQPWKLGFWSLIVTQFQVAFSDNALRFLVTFLGISLWTGNREAVVPLVGALFSAPFLLFSMAGGYLADRFSKRSVTVTIKCCEIGVMLLALAGLALRNLPLALAGVFLMGTHSAFFGPSKYGLLPELLPEERLSWGNGILEMGTFLAIILGSQAGAWMFAAFRNQPASPGLILVSLGIAGLFMSLAITRVPAANPAKVYRMNFLGDLAAQVRLIRRDRTLWLAVVGNVYFSFLGMLVQQNIVLYGMGTLAVGEVKTGYLMAALALGIGIGSVSAGYLSGGKIEYGLIPLGAIGLTVFSAALFWPHSYNAAFALLTLLGFFGGFFIVPVAAILQHRPEKGNKGGVLAAGNLLSFVGIFLATGVYYALTSGAHWTPHTIFLIGGLATLAGTIYVTILLPDSLLRLLLWMLTHTLYRIRVDGRENLPETGGALLVCNHVSFIDAVLLLASTDRFIRFLMFQDYYDHPLLKPFVRILRVIPISSHLGPRDMIRSLREATEAIEAGELVCIFAEGQITRIGELLPFQRGFQRIIKGTGAPIIPVNLDGVWGSIFSFEGGRFLWKWPRRIPYPITVSFGPPLPSTASPEEVRHAVRDLQTEAFAHHREWIQTLPAAFVRTARRHPFRFAMADGRSGPISFGTALVRSVFLARRLRKTWENQTMVGVLLPPSVPGALMNFAAFLMGKIPVNLNYTLSDDAIASCARQCEIQTVITSREFLERVKIQVPGQAVFLEELAAAPRWSEKLLALAMAWTLPQALLAKALGAPRETSLDDLATVIFSSGSTGDPKGVMLTHYNLGSNIEQLNQVFSLSPRDRVLGILPFFHSFGFTGTLAMTSVVGLGVVYHPSPLDAAAIGKLVREYAVTLLVATPTFLQSYMRRCSPEDFGSLTLVLAGAEKLPERLSRAFQDTFGIIPMEGYGCTECSPAIAVNRTDFRGPGFRQVGGKRGKIGQPLPGISVRIVDPDTMEPVPAGQSGLLLVRGPNVMKGYLGQPEKTQEAIRDGWYITGDIVSMDEDGFLEITDRLSRFSKIGGEMVPHMKVEEKLQELAGLTEQRFAVTSVPDGKKGERLIVLHTLPDDQLKDCLQKFSDADLPNLWKPRANQFFRIDSLPSLGTGKLDLRKLREMAVQLSESP